MRTLEAADVARLLPMRDAIDVVAKAFNHISRSEGLYPQRLHMRLAEGDALVMPGYDGATYLGIKIATIHRAGAVHATPGTRASYLLIDAGSGEPRLLCDGTMLTALRTGAASGLATRRLARADAATLAVFGVGGQATAQLEAMFAVRPIRDVRVVSRQAEHADAFIVAMQRLHPAAHFERRDADAAIAGAAIILTATSSSTPVFDGTRVGPGTHINAIGSYRADMRELDAASMRGARVVVDQRSAALAEAGEVIDAIAQGVVDADDIAELGEIGDDARARDDEITVFKMVGHAALDLFMAAELLRRSMPA